MSRLTLPRVGAVLAAAALTLAGLDGPSAGGVAQAQTAGPATAPEIPTPLATSVQTLDGTWATIPMGRLDEPLNTFWQLFYRPNGAVAWSNRVEATATATNGGLVLAADGPIAAGGSAALSQPQVHAVDLDIKWGPVVVGRAGNEGAGGPPRRLGHDRRARAGSGQQQCWRPSAGRCRRHFDVADFGDLR